MSLYAAAVRLAERAPIPDSILRAAIDHFCGQRARSLAATTADEAGFARGMAAYPIAQFTDAANEQHYELPPRFFELTLGPRRKYSCCHYPTGLESLEEAELAALEQTVSHAALADGQTILELGCGWGSLSLFMAERYPNARIVAVSNSAPQRLHIEAMAKARGFANLSVVTADMNHFAPGLTFDRIVSVEMFEHMANWQSLLARARTWLEPDGRLFLHVFSHRTHSYRFDPANRNDWIAQHFFSGGIMPSHGLIGQFAESFAIEDQWWWNGTHYQRTARQWLANFDRNRAGIDAVLREVYGKDAGLWRRRWRLFYLATEGLWGHARGREWGVSHYCLKPA
jgi:cyclopropane-fatty-acyl-phospholipid synthase